MTGLLFLIPIAIALGLLALGAFLWALRAGQYDDLKGAGERILDDSPPPAPSRGRRAELPPPPGRDGPT